MSDLVPADTSMTYDIEQVHGDDVFNEMAKGFSFLPRLQLFGSNTQACGSGLVQVGTYGLVTGKDKIIQLGKEVDIFAFVWRPKALDMRDLENVIAYHDPKDPEFQEIQELSGESDSGCMFGPEYLVWVPQLTRFATLLFGNKSARMEAPNLKARLGKPSTLTVNFVKKSKYAWHVIVVNECSTPFVMPTPESVKAEVTTFNAPPLKVIEDQEVSAPVSTGRVV